MALLNPPGILPQGMWAVVRLLATQRKPLDLGDARQLLQPSSLPLRKSDDLLEFAVKALIDLGIVETGTTGTPEQIFWLRREVSEALAASFAGFARHLRSAITDPELNSGLADSPSDVGPRDLTRALCWFLSLDPTEPLTFEQVYKRQSDVNRLPAPIKAPFSNSGRWDAFVRWSRATGFTQHGLVAAQDERSLVPDPTTAVRDTLETQWADGSTVPAEDLVRQLRHHLPVLPGGHWSQALAMPCPADRVDPVLSWALLRGQQDGWLTLHSRSDAQVTILTDPAQPGGQSRITHVTTGRGQG
jgi:hypothetical protein